MAGCGLLQYDVVCVYRRGKGYHFGIILENADSLSSSEDEDTDEDRLKKGFVRVAWYPTGRESVIAEEKVKLVERSLMPGDTIQRSTPGQSGQSGIIMDMDVKCHLHIKRTNKYIYNVDSKDLQPLIKFESGQDVVLDDMLGRVIYVNTFFVLLFSDGARCRADESYVSTFDDATEKRERHGEFGSSEFYEGQEIRGSLYNLAEAEWLHSTTRHSAKTAKKKGNHTVTITIEKILTDSVDVQWIFRVFQGDDPNRVVTPPYSTVQGEQLKKLRVLDWFDYSSLEMADRMNYRIKNDDRVSTVEPSHLFDSASLTIKEQAESVPTQNNCETDGHVADGSCSIQNGEASSGTLKDQEEEDYEDESDNADEGKEDADKTANGGNKNSKKKKRGGYKAGPTKFKSGKQQGQKSGAGAAASNHHKKSSMDRLVSADSLVQVEVMFTNSLAIVMWQDGSVDHNIPSSELHPVDFGVNEFFPGDFVLPQLDMDIKPDYGAVVKCNHVERTCIINWYNAFDGVKEKEPTLLRSNDEVSIYDIKDHTVFDFHHGQIVGLVNLVEPIHPSNGAGFVGQILKLDPPGRVTVKWSNGTISQCFPQEMFKVLEEDDDDDSSDDSSWEDESESADTWETESEQEIIGEEPEKDEKCSTTSVAKQKQELQSLLSRAESALIRLKTLLNSFDVSMTAPECFHDIIRIYRSCHDVDKILRSNFFSDPELQSLIAQAKLEVKRDKASKITQHLSQLLESWGMPGSEGAASERRSIRFGTSFSCNMLNLTMRISNENDSGLSVMDETEKNKCEEASSAGELSCDRDKNTEDSGMEESSSGNGTVNNVRNSRMLRKEYSEPLISDKCRDDRRRPSDPALQAEGESNRGQNDSTNVNLVGENCVGKAAKITKSNTYDNSSDAKNSQGEASDFTGGSNHTRELCFKICENLQKQILKIHEEVNKRTSRIINIKKELEHVEVNKDCDTISSTVNSKEDGAGVVCQVSSESFITNDTFVVDKQKETSGNVESTSAGEGVSDSIETTEPLSAVDSEEKMALNDADDGDLVLPKGFSMKEGVGSLHKFAGQPYQPLNPRAFNIAVKKELRLLQYSLPDGIFIKGFEDRLDLYSVMILGPAGTPYEDAFFLFDFMLPKDYPKSPPLCHYHSYCTDRLNPNLYEDGKICVSLLGTWSGKGSEMWTSKSNLLQVLLSIQGLILVSEPYYNEAGYERHRGTQVGAENSRMYNEMAILKTVQSLTRMCHKIPVMFEEEIQTHLVKCGPRLVRRLRMWMAMQEENGKITMEESSVDATTTTATDVKVASTKNGDNSGGESQAMSDKLQLLQMNGLHLNPESSVDGSNFKTPSSARASIKNPNTQANEGASLLNADDDIDLNKKESESSCNQRGPEFSLFPLSRGFCLTLCKTLDSFEKGLLLLKSST